MRGIPSPGVFHVCLYFLKFIYGIFDNFRVVWHLVTCFLKHVYLILLL